MSFLFVYVLCVRHGTSFTNNASNVDGTFRCEPVVRTVCPSGAIRQQGFWWQHGCCKRRSARLTVLCTRQHTSDSPGRFRFSIGRDGLPRTVSTGQVTFLAGTVPGWTVLAAQRGGWGSVPGGHLEPLMEPRAWWDGVGGARLPGSNELAHASGAFAGQGLVAAFSWIRAGGTLQVRGSGRHGPPS